MTNKKPAGLENHLVELRKKHAAFSDAVEKLVRVPGHCNLKLSELKKQKLRLKEEIEHLEKNQRSGESSMHTATAVKDVQDVSEPSIEHEVLERPAVKSGDCEQEAA